jgi:type II secretory pathway pseudopilin PulG
MTLIEVFIAAGIVAFLGVATYQIFRVTQRAWKSDMELVQLQNEARRALDAMVSELRSSTDAAISVVDIDGNNNITFDLPGQNSVSYYLFTSSYGGVNIPQIIRDATAAKDCDTNPLAWQAPGNCEIAGSHIVRLFFCCWHDDGMGGEVCDSACANSTRLEIRVRAEKQVCFGGELFACPVLSYPGDNTRFIKAVMRLRNE